MRFPTPAPQTTAWWRRTTSRRTLLRGGIVLAPAVLVGAWLSGVGRRTARAAGPRGVSRSRQAAPACVVSPVLTEGPYFVNELLYRSDIRSDPTTGAVKDGVSLYLGFYLSSVGSDGGCTPLAGAVIDIWQCDALGVYSDVNDPGFSTKGQQFLRGSQHTDENGYTEFLTIYPGWYAGRTVHTHLKVRTDPSSESGYESNSQVFYDDALSDQMFTLPPYSSKGTRDTRNADDGIYQQSGGATLLDIQPTDEGQAYRATIDIGVDLSAPAQPAGPGGPLPPSMRVS